jgi:ribosomal protein S16
MAESVPSIKDNVFINCPFDRRYKPILNAIVFAIHDAGFVARCGLEVIDSGPTRLATIISIISECTYGIHDISRTETGGKSKLPRFNMPFECGLFWGCLSYGEKRHTKKRILVLDSEEYRYRKSISDISGQDIKAHNNDPRIAMDKVRSWLNAGSKRTTIPGGKAIWDHYVLFQKELTPILKRAGITRSELNTPEYYPDYCNFIVNWLREREAKAANK